MKNYDQSEVMKYWKKFQNPITLYTAGVKPENIIAIEQLRKTIVNGTTNL